jgi:O-acetylhomoserine (thiol)-lyase
MHLETLCLHAGYSSDPTTLACAVPIYRTASYVFKSTEHAANLFALRELGNIYTRLMNPTHDVLEQRVAALEGGAAGLAIASGTSAIFYSIINLAQAGDNIVSAQNLYGGTYTQFKNILPALGIEVRFVDSNHPENFAAAIDGKTRALFCETVSNPSLEISDIEAISKIAHAHGLPLIVDSTFSTPYLTKPIEHGADIVVHSLTKWLGGHGTSIGGIVVDSGTFPWADNKTRFPLLNTPDPSYHGVTYTEAFGPAAFIGRCRVVPLRNMGAALSPMNAFQILQGIETLALRMDRICENAVKVATHLQNHPKVAWVNYAGLPGHKDRALVQQYMGGRASGIISFGLKSSDAIAAGTRFQDALQLFTRLVNIGDAKSLACHPATTTHRQLNPDEMKKAGVSPDMVRLSIGIEHIDDLMADLEQALEQV